MRNRKPGAGAFITVRQTGLAGPSSAMTDSGSDHGVLAIGCVGKRLRCAGSVGVNTGGRSDLDGPVTGGQHLPGIR